MQSHPMWVRGLKQTKLYVQIPVFLSHPMWVRGLKQDSQRSAGTYNVAPYVGAWIETV